MKVSNNKDQVDLSHASRAKRGEKTKGAAAKEQSAGATAAAVTGDVANVDISSEAKALASANAIARSAPEADEAKIARVKAAINGGTYKPDFGKVADKMISETLAQETS